MKKIFKTIGIIGRQRTTIETSETLNQLVAYLLQNHYTIVIETETATCITITTHFKTAAKHEIAECVDLIIVVGGDGSLLNAAHMIVDHHKPVLGINRGRLGFLTDIHPDELIEKVSTVLQGNYIEEKRFLLNGYIKHHTTNLHTGIALNDIVLSPGKYSHMIEFEIYIDQQFVCSQRADGQIIATPTGSTAYALSGGGPILHPKLDAMVLVPMFSHTLSSRPIVVTGRSKIAIHIGADNETSPMISFDGGTRIAIAPGDSLHVEKTSEELILLHLKDYNYYETLRTKLHWQTKL